MSRLNRFLPLVALLLVALLLPAAYPACAQFPTAQPLPGVTYLQETRTNPPQRLFSVRVDLKNPRVHVRVSPGGPDPDAAGPWKTTLMVPTAVATRDGLDLVVNGDFFSARNTKDAEGRNSGYITGIWASPIGPAVTDGRIWSASPTPRPCLVVHKDGRVTIEPVGAPATDAWEVVSGNTMLVADGKPVPQTNTARHPRTVVGLDQKGSTLVILVVDGRRAGVATGMDYDELAHEMIRLGCWTAMNLDGGGSSEMAIRDPATGKYQVVNTPSDGRERSVADILGVAIDKDSTP